MTTNNKINATLRELAEYRAMAEELKVQIEALEAETKQYMSENGIEELIGENGEKATFKKVESNRFDKNAFIKDFGKDSYNEYCKLSAYMRFTFNA